MEYRQASKMNDKRSDSKKKKSSSFTHNNEKYRLYEENKILERQVFEYKQTVHSQA